MIACVHAQVPVNFLGTIKRVDAFASKYVAARTIAVWLPQDYDSTKKYPVLYMHDGQNLFDSTITFNHQEWKVAETVTRLVREKKMRSCIVVAIWNTGMTRWNEYFPQKAVTYFSGSDMNTFTTTYLKNPLVADEYLKFLAKELKPFIDKTFPTLSDRNNTFIAGSSIGVIIGATGTPNGFNTMGNSLNLDRRIGENVLWRIEARMLQSEDKIFVDDKAVASQSNTFFTTSLSIELP